MLRASPGRPYMATRATHAFDPWRLREKLATLVLSCNAASQGSPSLANPLVACDEPLFFTPRHVISRIPLLETLVSFTNGARCVGIGI